MACRAILAQRPDTRTGLPGSPVGAASAAILSGLKALLQDRRRSRRAPPMCRQASAPIFHRAGVSSRARALQLVDAARPVVLEETRKRPIREQPAAGLTARAVVGLVLRVADALHGRAAVGARLAIA